jgi:hypothetical protein
MTLTSFKNTTTPLLDHNARALSKRYRVTGSSARTRTRLGDCSGEQQIAAGTHSGDGKRKKKKTLHE